MCLFRLRMMQLYPQWPLRQAQFYRQAKIFFRLAKVAGGVGLGGAAGGGSVAAGGSGLGVFKIIINLLSENGI